jgi:hypothetical protein
MTQTGDDVQIFAAFAHSFGRDWGSGLLNLGMEVEEEGE